MAKRKKKTQEPRLHLIPDQVAAAEEQSYFYVAQRYWPSLLFILPMLIAFEVGEYLDRGTTGKESSLLATWLIERLMNALGSTGPYFPGPALLVVVILLASHLGSRHSWKFDVWVLPGMLGESLIWTMPLMILDRVIIALAAGTSPGLETWRDQVLQSFGAGIYEELLFRFVCMNLLFVILVDLIRLPQSASALFIVLASAGLFAAHHHPPFGAAPFEMGDFLFRTAAGIYLAVLFYYRGFGIAAGCHALYNALFVTLRSLQ